MNIHIDVRDDIPCGFALECVEKVVLMGNVSEGEHGKIYCWAVSFSTPIGEIVVSTRQYRKSDCFVVYKNKK